MRRLSLAILVLFGLFLTSSLLAMTPDESIARLKEGNDRFVAGRSLHPDESASRRTETAADGQHPFATILACSDSRVPVEAIFDQGIGDIFVIRVAGNVSGESEIGSMEYGVEHTGTPLLVVLGHSQCGAVTAAATHAEAHGKIESLVERIGPAVAVAQKEHPDLHGKELVPAAVEANVWHSIEELLRNSPVLRETAASGKVKIVGAIYDLKGGQVQWLGEHPRQQKLLEEN